MSNSSKKSRFFRDLRHVRLVNSTEDTPKRDRFKLRVFRVNKSLKILMALTIITIVMVSVFAFLPKGTESKPDIDEGKDTPTASPSSTPESKATPTTVPNPFSAVTHSIIDAGNSIQKIIDP